MSFTQNWISPPDVVVCPSTDFAVFVTLSNQGGGNYVLTANPSGGEIPYSYFWSINPTAGVTENNGFTSSTYDITITNEGVYTAKLIASDNAGANRIVSKTITYVEVIGSFDNSFDNSFD